MKKKILIIGGDSKLGVVLKSKLKKKKINFIATSRQKNSKYFLDLKNIKKFKLNKDLSSCVILAGITDYYDCEKKKELSRKVNCKNIIKISKEILKRNIFLCYVSTNTVFNSLSKQNEKDKPKPKFEYAKQKYYVEKNLIKYVKKNNKTNLLSILRLTKNVSTDIKPFQNWVIKIINHKKIKAFDDLYFSPILFENSADAIKKILSKKVQGIFHLSNKQNLNYYQFATKLFLYLKIDPKKIIKTNSKKEKVKLIFKNKQSALSMKYSRNILNMKYINLIQIFKYFKKKNK